MGINIRNNIYMETIGLINDVLFVKNENDMPNYLLKCKVIVNYARFSLNTIDVNSEIYIFIKKKLKLLYEHLMCVLSRSCSDYKKGRKVLDKIYDLI